MEYCVTLSGASATPLWSDFNTECWSNDGAFLAGPPDDATFIHFIVPAVAAARAFDFCVISIDFALGPGRDAGREGAADGASDAASDAASEGATESGADAASEGAAQSGADAASEGAADAVSESASDGAAEAAGD